MIGDVCPSVHLERAPKISFVFRAIESIVEGFKLILRPFVNAADSYNMFRAVILVDL